jgi:hypothetical protein
VRAPARNLPRATRAEEKTRGYRRDRAGDSPAPTRSQFGLSLLRAPFHARLIHKVVPNAIAIGLKNVDFEPFDPFPQKNLREKNPLSVLSCFGGKKW